MRTLQDFLNDLGARESGGNYKAFNKFGYAGKYQMGEAALIDCGYYKKNTKIYNNDWKGIFTGKDNVYCIRPADRTNGITMHLWNRIGNIAFYKGEKSRNINYAGLCMFVSGKIKSANFYCFFSGIVL